MSEIEIMKASKEDWEPAMEVAWRTFLKFEAMEYGKEGTDHFLEFISGEQLYEMFLNGEYKVVVAKKSKKVLGVASLRAGNHVSLLFVDEKYHKLGIGKKLLAFLQSNCLEKDSVTLTVNAAPYAVNFYEKVGFERVDDFQKADGIIYLPMMCLKKINV